jgi:hypothetical protein
MRISKWEQLSALTGLAAAALLLIAGAIQGALPAADAATRTIADFFSTNHQRIMVAMFIRLFAGFAFIWFLGTLRSALSRAEGETGRLSAVAFGAGLIVLSSSATTTAALTAGAFRANEGVNPAIASTLVTAVSMFYVISAMGTSWLLIASFFVTLRTAVFPMWVGWLGLGIALVNLIVPLFAFGKSLVQTSGLLVLLWVSIVSVLLFRQPNLAGPVIARTATTPTTNRR